MAKLNWEIHRPDYGRQGVIVARTRAEAIAIAEADHLKRLRYLEASVEFDPIPAFTATKVTEVTPYHFPFSFT